MPIDFSCDSIPNFRDLSQTGLVLLRRPVVRSRAEVRRLRLGQVAAGAPLLRPAKILSGTR